MKIENEQINSRFRQHLENIYKQQAAFYKDTDAVGQSKNSIITKFGDLKYIDTCSKRLPLISENNLFLEKVSPSNLENVDYHVMETKILDRTSISFGTAIEESREEVWFRTNDYQLLEAWFDTSSQMINSRRVLYVPIFETIRSTQEYNYSYTGENPGEFLDNTARNLKIIQRSPINYHTPFQATADSDIETTDKSLIPLLKLDIPAFENISASQLSKVMDDYPDKLLRFRNYLQKALINLETKIGSEDLDREIRLLNLEITDGLMNLKDDVNQLNKITAIEVIGAQLVTWSLHVFAFMSSPNEILKILLPGGAISSLSLSSAKYIKEKYQLSKNPLNFLLHVTKKAKRIS